MRVKDFVKVEDVQLVFALEFTNLTKLSCNKLLQGRGESIVKITCQIGHSDKVAGLNANDFCVDSEVNIKRWDVVVYACGFDVLMCSSFMLLYFDEVSNQPRPLSSSLSIEATFLPL